MQISRPLSILAACASLLIFAGCTTTSPKTSKPRPALKIKSTQVRANEPLRREVVMVALSTLGVRYKWGGNTPEEGMDCSGLVKFAYDGIDVSHLPRTSRELAKSGKSVPRHKLRPGDLVFFNTIGRRANSHVGIYMGEGKFINAPSKGKKIRIDTMNSGYYAARYNGARRILSNPI